MKTYLVTWEIEIDAKSPKDAAKKALKIQRDKNSTALVFDVIPFGKEPKRIDLCE